MKKSKLHNIKKGLAAIGLSALLLSKFKKNKDDITIINKNTKFDQILDGEELFIKVTSCRKVDNNVFEITEGYYRLLDSQKDLHLEYSVEDFRELFKYQLVKEDILYR